MKCDGKRPICARCQGYGYSCAYSQPRNRPNRLKNEAVLSAVHLPNENHLQSTALRDAVQEFEDIVDRVSISFPEDQKHAIGLSLRSAKSRLDNAFAQFAAPGANLWDGQMPARRALGSRFNPERYLGEVSDVRFFNHVKRAFEGNGSIEQTDTAEGMDSYEQDLHPATAEPGTNASFALPDLDAAQEYIDAYFSTIHIAYPFIPYSTFLKKYHLLRENGVSEEVDFCWLALLHIIFAIGAYYSSFPGNGASATTLHRKFFQRAQSLVNIDKAERTSAYITFLLAQCFYLLAICNTDRCWVVLGQAIRISQSIGLHVETKNFGTASVQNQFRSEARRRIWYCIYVLDRLLSLQLGRPPAIHDDDCHVSLPWRSDPAEIDWEADDLSRNLIDRGPSAGDYFLSMIAFSRIVGLVLRELYHPRREKLAMNELISTRNLDIKLMDWRASLPRHLRFDLGHTFQKSVAFKRQRNMLAVKFHHLRALIHRPYLCLSLLRKQDSVAVSMLQSEAHEVNRYESICVSEAQKTASLLHNVGDEKELVHDFPWWQMISCLICASSILLVASSFANCILIQEGNDNTALIEDLETCLNVFEALSSNSDAAKIAKEMIERLRNRGLVLAQHESYFEPQKDTSDHQVPVPLGSLPAPSSVFYDHPDDLTLLTPQDWPSEILDSMAWSARFFNTSSSQTDH